MNARTFQFAYYGLRLVLFPKVKVSARLPLAQASLESANFTSNVYKSYNNMFGMMQPQVRKTKSIGGSPSGFATFASPYLSIWDYLLFLEQLGLLTDSQLENYIATKYAADKKYYPKVVATANAQAASLLDPVKIIGLGLAGLAVLLVGGSILKKALK